MSEKFLTPEEMAEIEAMGGFEKLMETLKKRLEEQKKRHEGGNKMIGTGGTSPFGANGYNPEGVRIGQDKSRHRRAVKVWDKREFKNYDDKVELGTRNIKIAMKRLRKWARKGAQDELDALILFKGDMGAYLRLYAFLGQIFDYGNTEIEKRLLFFRRLLPLLEFGRERDTVDLSRVVLTHHTLKGRGRQPMALNPDGSYKLSPMDAVGSGSVQDKQQAYLAEIIEKVNGLFQGQLTDEDQLLYVNGVIKGKLLENQTLVQQASSNSKEQFANSPDLKEALMHAIMDALDAHQTMSTQALGSERVRDGLKDILLGPAQLYEALRSRGTMHQAHP